MNNCWRLSHTFPATDLQAGRSYREFWMILWCMQVLGDLFVSWQIWIDLCAIRYAAWLFASSEVNVTWWSQWIWPKDHERSTPQRPFEAFVPAFILYVWVDAGQWSRYWTNDYSVDLPFPSIPYFDKTFHTCSSIIVSCPRCCLPESMSSRE